MSIRELHSHERLLKLVVASSKACELVRSTTCRPCSIFGCMRDIVRLFTQIHFTERHGPLFCNVATYSAQDISFQWIWSDMDQVKCPTRRVAPSRCGQQHDNLQQQTQTTRCSAERGHPHGSQLQSLLSQTESLQSRRTHVQQERLRAT
jgi:hypothetical protein